MASLIALTACQVDLTVEEADCIEDAIVERAAELATSGCTGMDYAQYVTSVSF